MSTPGSAATALAPGRASMVELVERKRSRTRATICYDPNVRPALLGASARPGITGRVAVSDFVRVGDGGLRGLCPDRKRSGSSSTRSFGRGRSRCRAGILEVVAPGWPVGPPLLAAGA
jgi:hypothetical protein